MRLAFYPGPPVKTVGLEMRLECALRRADLCKHANIYSLRNRLKCIKFIFRCDQAGSSYSYMAIWLANGSLWLLVDFSK